MKISTIFLIIISAPSLAQTLTFDQLSDHPYHERTTHIIEQAYAQIGYDIEYQSYPLKRSYMEANKSNLSGLMLRVEQEKGRLPEFIKVPVPMGHFKVVLLINTHLCPQCNLQDLARVASVSGYAALEKIVAKESLKYNAYYVPYRVTLFNIFKHERVDGIIISDVFLDEAMLQKNPHWQLVELGQDTLYHYLHKDAAHLLPLVSSAITQLTSTYSDPLGLARN